MKIEKIIILLELVKKLSQANMAPDKMFFNNNIGILYKDSENFLAIGVHNGMICIDDYRYDVDHNDHSECVELSDPNVFDKAVSLIREKLLRTSRWVRKLGMEKPTVQDGL